jgi:excisionase family DNA binding protein
MTEEHLVGPEEIAARLGISRLTAVRWLHAGKLRGRKIGRKQWRMRASDLEAYIAQEPTPPAGTPEPGGAVELPFPIVDAVEER